MKYYFKIIGLAFLTINSFSFAQNYGAWQQIDSLKEARYSHSAIQLANGNILIVSGAGLADQKDCEIYDINSKLWSEVTKTNFARGLHRLIMLNSKRVLAVGSSVTKFCEIYDPVSNKWILTDTLKVRRVLALHEIVKLLDGRILAIGGYTYDYSKLEEQTLRMCEVYDETTDKWSIVDSMKTRRSSHSATLLKDGKVLVAGGGISPNPLASCEIYDPVQNKWINAAPMNIARENHNAVLLPDGKVLVIAGYGKDNIFPTRSVELYDPVLDKWKIVDSIKVGESAGSAFILDDKYILLVGSNSNQTLIWEIYDYTEFRSKYVGYVNTKSFSNNKIQLVDGRVLVTGGVMTINSEIYYPVKTCWIFDKNLTHVEDINNQQESNLIFQNYPNPFNGSTTIKFFIEKSSNVQITIYNTLGAKIEDLINERKERGYHEALFSNVSLPSGVYYCRIVIDKETVTKKLLLIK